VILSYWENLPVVGIFDIAHAIQGIGVFLVESITGSYTNVVGLPLCALTRALVTCGALNIFPLR